MRNVATLLLIGFTLGLTLWVGCSGMDPAPIDGGNPPAPDAGGDAGTGSDGGTTQPLPLDAACGAINSARCAYLQQCGLLASGEAEARDCEQYFTATECGPARWPSRVKEGTLRYNSEKALSCVADWNARACADYRGAPSSCAEITSPAALLGDICYGGLRTECTEGTCTGGTCPRHCRLPAATGGVCELDSDCKPSLYCQRSLQTGSLGTCTAFGGDGDACDGARQPCAPGYICGEFSLCHVANKIGQACAPGTCEPAGFCAYDKDGGTCLARLTASQACAGDGQCRSDLLCLAENGTCQSRGPVPLNAPCSRRQSCADPLACVGTQVDPFSPPVLGKCLAPRAQGEACTSSYDCVAPFACIEGADGGLCAARQPDGAKCAVDRDCQHFSRCQNASCTPRPVKNEPCSAGSCLYGACGPGADGGEDLCKGTLGGNQPCASDFECSSLRCVSGSCLVACTP